MKSMTNMESVLLEDAIQLLSIWTIMEHANSANMVHTWSKKDLMPTEFAQTKSAKSINTMIYVEIAREIIALISSITITTANVSFVRIDIKQSFKDLLSN
jgi:hypothetical protein